MDLLSDDSGKITVIKIFTSMDAMLHFTIDSDDTLHLFATFDCDSTGSQEIVSDRDWNILIGVLIDVSEAKIEKTGELFSELYCCRKEPNLIDRVLNWLDNAGNNYFNKSDVAKWRELFEDANKFQY